MTALLVVLCLILIVTIDLGRLWWHKRHEAAAPGGARVRPFAALGFPRGLFLDHSHTWLRLTDSGELRVGVDELLAQAMDGADRMELPASGAKVTRGQPLATLWRRDHKLVVPSPVDGTVVTSNHALTHYVHDLEEDPYGAGWLACVWPTEHREALKALSVGEGARQWLQREVARFADFMAAHTGRTSVGMALADGAHPVVGAALHLDDSDWRVFQREFASIREN